MFEKINNYYKERTGKDLDLNIEINLTKEQEEYIHKKILKYTTEVTEPICTLANIVYMNLLSQRKVGVL